jgi:NhaP-type Na+/H+ or K+/H+ antiporter
MLDSLTIITAIAVLLFVGLICSWLASKMKLPDVLLLIIVGVAFGHTQFRGKFLIEFPELFLTSMAILALAMIIFDSTARLRLREFDVFSGMAIKLTLISLFLNLTIFTAAAKFILGVDLWLALLLATVIVGTSPDILLPLAMKKKKKALTYLKLESVFNTPLTVLLPFIVVDLMESVQTEIVAELIEQLVPFVMKFIVGLGAGVFVGLILFKLMQKAYKELYSPLAVIVAALLSYVLAENMGGSGVLAVTALGVFFGNVYLKEKPSVLSVESVFTKGLYILVFILVGMIIKIPLTWEFMIKAFALILVYYITRFIAVNLTFKRDKTTAKERLYMTLNAPKGIATAAVVFILAVYRIEGVTLILDLTLTFVLVSIIISSIVTWSSDWFLSSSS